MATMTVSAKVGKKIKSLKKSLGLRVKSGKCGVSALYVLPKSFRHKKVAIKLSFRGNPFLGKFSFRSSFRN
jgi:hypothetical protein